LISSGWCPIRGWESVPRKIGLVPLLLQWDDQWQTYGVGNAYVMLAGMKVFRIAPFTIHSKSKSWASSQDES
jgi:hypothetical protein